MQAVIKARGLSKSYGSKRVLDSIDLDLMPGRILGLIGPNGAGKTTLLKAILGLAPAQGELAVLGLNPHTQRTQMLQEISFIADTAILPRWLKVKQALEYLEGVHPRFDRAKAEVFLQRTEVKTHMLVRQLSKGMLTQLHLALVMAIDSKLLVLDEPTLGLDILYRKQFYNTLLDDYFDKDKTILITTHQVEEIENLLTDVVFIRQGKLCLNASMEELQDRFIELQLTDDQLAKVAGHTPIHSRPILGGKALIFEGGDREFLCSLGPVKTPSLADIFVAKMHGERS